MRSKIEKMIIEDIRDSVKSKTFQNKRYSHKFICQKCKTDCTIETDKIEELENVQTYNVCWNCRGKLTFEKFQAYKKKPQKKEIVADNFFKDALASDNFFGDALNTDNFFG